MSRFIIDNVESVEALNVLILLHANPSRMWSADEVGKDSRTNEWSAQMCLDALSQRGLVRANGGEPPRYAAEPAVAPIVAAVTRAYHDRRVAVITLIYSKPDEPPKPDPIQAFADAFKLKKDK